jgi:hypothetical protein
MLLGLAGFSVSLFGSDLDTYNGSGVSVFSNNPHRIPDYLNPRLISSSEHEDVSYKVDESSIGSIQDLHGVAFANTKIAAHPTLDYTTGTSN